MKRIIHKNDLPEWFKLDNYISFNEISDFDIRNEFRKRIMSERDAESSKSHSFLEEIKRGQPISKPFVIPIPSMSEYLESRKKAVPIIPISEAEQETYDELVRDARAFESREAYGSISPFLMDDLNTANRVFEASFSETIRAHSEADIHSQVKEWPIATVMNKSINNGALRGKITINLDLENCTDKEILSDLEKHLKVLREMSKIPEPETINPRAGDYDKAKEYRVFALFDLLYWARLNNTQIKKSVLAVAVFPNGEKGEGDLNDTIKKYMNKVFSLQYRH
jgi:hypothetical protein